MAQTIHRKFDSHERASQAADELHNHLIDRFEDVHGFSNRAASGGELSTDEIVVAMMDGYVLKADARVLAEGIKRGGTLVTVHAPFGTAITALKVLEQHQPVDSGLPEFKEERAGWDEAAPLSSALHIPTLLPDSATFSRFWNVSPLVKSGGTTSAALGLPEISHSSEPYSGVFPMPLLSHKPAPLSSMLGLPLLTKARPAKR
jgi:hypothetical protein